MCFPTHSAQGEAENKANQNIPFFLPWIVVHYAGSKTSFWQISRRNFLILPVPNNIFFFFSPQGVILLLNRKGHAYIKRKKQPKPLPVHQSSKLAGKRFAWVWYQLCYFLPTKCCDLSLEDNGSWHRALWKVTRIFLIAILENLQHLEQGWTTTNRRKG